jgi:terminal-alkyne amino-acid exporter
VSTTRRTAPTARAMLAVAVLVWASAFPAIRVAVEHLGAGALTVGRTGIASVALAVLMVGRFRRPAARDLPRLAVVGLCGVTGYQFFLNLGSETVSAATASLLVNLAPVIAAAFAPLTLGEHLDRRRVVGIALAFGGSVPVSLADGGGFDPSIGALWAFIAAVLAGVFILVQKPLLDRYDALEVTAWSTWLSLVPALVFVPALVSDLGKPDAGDAVPSLLWLGIGASVIGYLAWAGGLRRTTASGAATWLYLIPVVAVLLAWWWLGETPGVATLAGGAVSLVGVWIATSGGLEDEVATPLRAD